MSSNVSPVEDAALRLGRTIESIIVGVFGFALRVAATFVAVCFYPRSVIDDFTSSAEPPRYSRPFTLLAVACVILVELARQLAATEAIPDVALADRLRTASGSRSVFFFVFGAFPTICFVVLSSTVLSWLVFGSRFRAREVAAKIICICISSQIVWMAVLLFGAYIAWIFGRKCSDYLFVFVGLLGCMWPLPTVAQLIVNYQECRNPVSRAIRQVAFFVEKRKGSSMAGGMIRLCEASILAATLFFVATTGLLSSMFVDLVINRESLELHRRREESVRAAEFAEIQRRRAAEDNHKVMSAIGWFNKLFETPVLKATISDGRISPNGVVLSASIRVTNNTLSEISIRGLSSSAIGLSVSGPLAGSESRWYGDDLDRILACGDTRDRGVVLRGEGVMMIDGPSTFESIDGGDLGLIHIQPRGSCEFNVHFSIEDDPDFGFAGVFWSFFHRNSYNSMYILLDLPPENYFSSIEAKGPRVIFLR